MSFSSNVLYHGVSKYVSKYTRAANETYPGTVESTQFL
jgi:hypothetical protein